MKRSPITSALKGANNLYFNDYMDDYELSTMLYKCVKKGLTEFSVTLSNGKRIHTGPLNVVAQEDRVAVFVNSLTSEEQNECLQSLICTNEIENIKNEAAYFVVVMHGKKPEQSAFRGVEMVDVVELFTLRMNTAFKDKMRPEEKKIVDEHGILSSRKFPATNIADYIYTDHDLCTSLTVKRNYSEGMALSRETKLGTASLTVTSIDAVFSNFNGTIQGLTFGQIKYMRECKDSYHKMLMRMEDCVTITSSADTIIRKLK